MSGSTATECHDAPAHPAGQGMLRLPFWLLVAGVLALCYFAQPFDPFYSLGPVTSVDSHIRAIREGNPARQASLLLMGMWAAASIVVHRSRLHLDGRIAALALLFLFLAAASVGWADEPLLAAKRAAALLAFSVSCVAIAERVGLDDAASFAFWVSALAVGVSAGAELALGTFRPFEPAYRFAGMMHPNVQGLYCACLTLAGVSLSRRRRPRGGAYAVGA
ncbi:MAG: hypothetical protein ACM3H9_07005, partial [Rhodospirillaceae bacterium]